MPLVDTPVNRNPAPSPLTPIRSRFSPSRATIEDLNLRAIHYDRSRLRPPRRIPARTAGPHVPQRAPQLPPAPFARGAGAEGDTGTGLQVAGDRRPQND